MSCSGLNIVGDTFGSDVKLATEQFATGLNWRLVKEAKICRPISYSTDHRRIFEAWVEHVNNDMQ